MNKAAIVHRVERMELHAHLFRITLTIAKPKPNQHIALPVWIPGSYLVREFSKHVQSISATQNGQHLALAQIDKCTWALHNATARAITVTYQVYAFDASVRTAYLDATRGFFNGTSLFMQVVGQEAAPQQVTIKTSPYKSWRVATALAAVKVNKTGWGIYLADNYDELADSPFELGDFWEGDFIVRGVRHRFVVSGAAPTFQGERLLADTKKIVATEMAFWHGRKDAAKESPLKELRQKGYVFMLRAVSDGYGGLEHKHSTALIAKRSDLPHLGESIVSDGYVTLLGLISHEYFHTWNVKRLRPTELAHYDYMRENHTQMLWFFEGFTSYYDDLLLRRAGLIDDEKYLSLVAKTINQVMQTPGRLIHSLANSSFEAWTKYYRMDENSINSTVSYYTKGALVALCLDLMLRSEGKTSLDAVMRELWVRSHQNGNDGVMSEQDLLDTLQTLSGRSFAKEIKAWVHETKDLPLSKLLATVGIETAAIKAPLSQRLGLRVSTDSMGIKIKTVLTGSAALKAGFAAGDEWVIIESQNQVWRVTNMDDVALYAQAGKPLIAWIARDKQMLKLPLMVPKNELTNADVKLKVSDKSKLSKWL